MAIVTTFIPSGHLMTAGEMSDMWGGGWIDLKTWLSVTFAYGSADSPTYVMTSDVDLTDILQPGMRVRLTQSSTTKYFIVTAVGAYSSSSMNITLLAPNDSTALANATISACAFSSVKAPFGFPIDPTKWFWQTKDTSDRTHASPTAGTWYNPGSLSLSVPIGAWRLGWQAVVVSGGNRGTASLSTSANSESDSDFSGGGFAEFLAGREKFVTVSSKTTYYLIIKTTGTASVGFSAQQDSSPTIIRATCAYL